ncbi:MAG TPA: response regulator [Chthoniobacterales bacterium]
MIQTDPIVYLVDDDASFRRSTERLLESAGFAVAPFSSARDFLRSKRPDGASCLVLDVQLPGVSGLDLQRELNKRGSKMPIIFITGHGDIPMSVRAIKAGAVEFLTKPFRDRDLLRALEQALKLRAKKTAAAGEHSFAREKSLFALHSAVDVDSFWKAIPRLVASFFPFCNLCMTLQHNPVRPLIAKWFHPIPDGPFNPKPLEEFFRAHPRSKVVSESDVFPNRADLLKSTFYREYMKPQECEHALGLFFWTGPRLACVITIMRNSAQGPADDAGLKQLRRLYTECELALRRISSLEREHSARAAFESFLRRLPLPTMLLRWTLGLAYQNKAAREFCLLWREGPEASRVMKATASPPEEILDGCRRLKKQWETSAGVKSGQPIVSEEVVYHAKWKHLRATISITHLNSVGLTPPLFLIQCEELRLPGAAPNAAETRLAHLARLTTREQEVTRLACDGRSNQEIADEAGLSLQMVKKHLHAIFRKLEVTSRSRLMALMG